MFLLHYNVRDFKFEIEEQKKVHLYVDMTNISPPSEKNVPLPMVLPHFLSWKKRLKQYMYIKLTRKIGDLHSRLDV